MTKTLTEQWRDKELKDGDYYIINKSGHIVCDYYIEILGHFDSVLTKNVKEVLAPVPDYQTWKDFQQHFVDKLELEVKLKKAYEQLEQESIKVVGLQEQLKEAVAFIEELSDACDEEGILFPRQRKKLEEIKKWGVK